MSTSLWRSAKVLVRRTLRQRWLSNRTLMGKAVLYNCFSIIATFTMSFLITGSAGISAGISALDFVGKVILYFLFEVGWTNLSKRA